MHSRFDSWRIVSVSQCSVYWLAMCDFVPHACRLIVIFEVVLTYYCRRL